MDLPRLTTLIRKACDGTVYRPNQKTATQEEIEEWEFLDALSDYVDGRAQSLINWEKDP